MRCATTNNLLGAGGLLVMQRLTLSSALTPPRTPALRCPRRHISDTETADEGKDQ